MSQPAAQRFGGDWTGEKLTILQHYLQAYTRALKRVPFELWYIDAFAGTGFIADAVQAPEDTPNLPGFPPEGPCEPLEGSARMALKVVPPFHRYVFIDKKKANALELAKLRDEFPLLADRIDVIKGDCNQLVQELCLKTNWTGKRAVLFLDPFGMQVDWATMQAIAATRVIDVWSLFPVGLGAARVLVRGGDVPAEWRACLDRVFGTKDWSKDLYVEKVANSLYGGEEKRTERVSVEEIATYYLERLKSIFPAVADNPRRLCGSKNVPLFYLYFAISNPEPKAIALAKKIAESIKAGKTNG